MVPDMSSERPLTVAVTGPTGTLGFGLLPLLQADERVGRIIGVARRPFDPAAHGWTKMDYRRGDVRDPDALRVAFEGADVVVHLAFLIVGGSRATTMSINVDGTLNTFRAAAAAGARRFVYTSSVAAYGFFRENPIGMTERWPVRPARRLFYAQEKAEVERLVLAEAARHEDLDVYLLRPPAVLGPHAVGGKQLPGLLTPLGRMIPDVLRRAPLRLPVAVPDLPLQVVHEDDVGRALLLCAVGAGPPGPYNIAADDVLSLVDVARELGLLAVPLPAGPAHAAAGLLARVPALPSSVEWLEALSHPAVMDTSRARELLGWSASVSGREALRDTLALVLRRP